MGLIGLSFFVMMTLFHLWDLPGDVLAAPESASGLDRCNLSLSLSLCSTVFVTNSGHCNQPFHHASVVMPHHGTQVWYFMLVAILSYC